MVRYRYDGWGNHKVMNPDGSKNESDTFIGNINPFRYRGYYYDVETGLYYLKTRYYDPETGRFITIDDISYLAPDTINGLNLYAYCGNNPVMNVDPEGTWSWNKFWKGLAIAFVVVAGAAAIIVTGGIASGAIAGGAVAFANAATTITLGIATGGLVGGYMQEAQGGSFWAGWIGGAVNGAIQAIGGLVLGPVGTVVGGFIGSFLGTATMQGLDSKYTEGYYKSFSEILRNSFRAGVVSAIFSTVTAYASIMVKPGNTTWIGGDIYNRIPGSSITPIFALVFQNFYSIIDDILSYIYS